MECRQSLTFSQWLLHAADELRELATKDPAISDVALEARRLLTDVLDIQPTRLSLQLDELLTLEQQTRLATALARRKLGEPLAYITGRWWFWDLELEVEPCTLIPRPDTEILVEQVLSLALPERVKLLDLGTGTGAIALSLAKAKPLWDVLGLDIQPGAVALATRNQTRLQLQNCAFMQSDWFAAVKGRMFDVIVTNPPYIDQQDPHLQQGDVRFEPSSALVAANQGLADLAHICQQAVHYLTPQGWLWLEHGYQQAEAVQQFLLKAGFVNISTRHDYGGQPRISGGMLAIR